MNILRLLLITFLQLLYAPSARAAKFTDITQQLDAADQATQPTPKPPVVRVQVSYQIQWPNGKAGTLDEQKAAIATMHSALYDMAAHECERLQAVAAGECRLVTITINNTSQNFNQTGSSQIGAIASFELQPNVLSKDLAPSH